MGMALYCNLTQNREILTWELEDLFQLRYLWEVLAGVGYRVVDAVRRSTTPSGAILRDFTFAPRDKKLPDNTILQDLIGRDL